LTHINHQQNPAVYIIKKMLIKTR